MSNDSVVTVEVPDGLQLIRLIQAGTIVSITPNGVTHSDETTLNWRDLHIRLRDQINRGRVLQLKMSPSEGKLRIVGGLNGMTVFDHILGDLPEMNDEFVDAIRKANDHLADWTRQTEAA